MTREGKTNAPAVMWRYDVDATVQQPARRLAAVLVALQVCNSRIAHAGVPTGNPLSALMAASASSWLVNETKPYPLWPATASASPVFLVRCTSSGRKLQEE